jgi:hypothetical protein
LEHDERPRFEALNGKSDQPSVNETKPALFSKTGNERFAIDAYAETFAMMTARRLQEERNLTRRNALLVRTGDNIAAAAAVSRHGECHSSSIGALLASFMLASNLTTQTHFIDINATEDVES